MNNEPAVFLTNEHGNEALVSRSVLNIRGANAFTPRTIKHVGTGDPKKICLLLNLEGLGSDIHAMPAIAQKIKEGFDVHVYARTFSEVCYRSLGCSTFYFGDIVQPHELVKILLERGHEFNSSHYGAIYNLSNWSQEHEFWHGLNTGVSRFQQFADLIETTLPNEFSWAESLLLSEETPRQDKIYVVPNSSSELRRYKDGQQLAELLGGETLNSEYESFSKLCSDIYHAKAVVAVDSGILALSCALGTPSFGLMTEASDGSTMTQYGKYLPNAQRLVVQTEMFDTTPIVAGLISTALH